MEPTSGMPTREDLATYESILDLLMANHLDFHIVDTDILQEGLIEDGLVRVADVSALVVLVAPMRVIEEPLQKWLEAYEASGGMVIRCRRNHPLDELQRVLSERVSPSLSVQRGDQEAAEVHVVKRVGPDRTLWFILNTSGETIDAEIVCDCELCEVPLDDALPTFLEGSHGRYTRVIREGGRLAGSRIRRIFSIGSEYTSVSGAPLV